MCVYLFLLLVVELSGEFVLALLAVSEVVVTLKILLPGTVRGLFTAANTGAGLGCVRENKGMIAVGEV